MCCPARAESLQMLMDLSPALPQPIKIAPEDGEAMRDVNDYPGFPNSLPVEFGLLLRRAWKQQSRDRMPMVCTYPARPEL